MQRGDYFCYQQHKIFFVDEGDPALPAVVLVHGFPTASWDFIKVWPALAEHYRLITLDMLGFGFSDKPDQRTYTINAQADLFAALLEQRHIEHYHLLAHDYGVSVAQELLARQFAAASNGSAQALSCCFLNGGLFPETHKALLIQKLLLSPLGPWLNRILSFDTFTKSFNRVFGPESKASERELELFWELINFNSGKHVFHNLITYMHDRRTHRERWLRPLQNSPIPLALINGSRDPVSGKHLVQRYQELNCRLDFLRELPAIGHYPQCEAADAVADAVLEFLRMQA